ncbi:unnamed protein product [Discula destructiva]
MASERSPIPVKCEHTADSQPDAVPSPDAAPENVEHIEIEVEDSNGNAFVFKIKKNTMLSKVMMTWAAKFNIDRNSLRFLFDGQRILDTDTPSILEMESGDIIHAAQEQLGGGLAPSV